MKRSKFSLSHYHLLTADMGKLIPLTWYEALPGDTIQQSTQMLIRMAPMVAPVMHPIRLRIHHWFVPMRLVWEDFEDFITGGPDGNFTAAFPKFVIDTTVAKGSLLDYLGFPTGDYSGNNAYANACPVRALNLIFNEFYRDQDLVDERAVSLASGDDTTTDMTIPSVAWEKDMFTTARPWPSKGDEIYLPLGGSAPVISDGALSTAGQTAVSTADANAPSGSPYDWGDHVYADLSQATGITVNELRNYLALQRYQENRARFGSRFSEYLQYLIGPGYKAQDARLQEPEYLSGGRQQIQISEILQTSRSDAGESPLGTMAGHGIAGLRDNRYRRFIPEHGIIMTLMSVVPKAMYQNAVPRKWHRATKESWFQKELQFIGEEEIANREVYNLHSDPFGVFGYTPRYESYKWEPSQVSGDFRDSLNHWHLAREFASDVALNSSFIECNPSKRIFADTQGQPLWIMANHSIQARRILQKWAKPRTF